MITPFDPAVRQSFAVSIHADHVLSFLSVMKNIGIEADRDGRFDLYNRTISVTIEADCDETFAILGMVREFTTTRVRLPRDETDRTAIICAIRAADRVVLSDLYRTRFGRFIAVIDGTKTDIEHFADQAGLSGLRWRK